MKKALISWRYDQVLWIIPQHAGEYFFICVYTALIFVWARVIIVWLSFFSIPPAIYVALGIGVFGYSVYRFLQLYMDSIVLTPAWVHILEQQWLFDTQETVFERNAIQSISIDKEWMISHLCKIGTLNITLEHGTSYMIWGVYRPEHRSKKIMSLKIIYEKKPEPIIKEPEKFDTLVDTLSEIITDYLQHKPQ